MSWSPAHGQVYAVYGPPGWSFFQWHSIHFSIGSFLLKNHLRIDCGILWIQVHGATPAWHIHSGCYRWNGCINNLVSFSRLRLTWWATILSLFHLHLSQLIFFDWLAKLFDNIFNNNPKRLRSEGQDAPNVSRLYILPLPSMVTTCLVLNFNQIHDNWIFKVYLYIRFPCFKLHQWSTRQFNFYLFFSLAKSFQQYPELCGDLTFCQLIGFAWYQNYIARDKEIRGELYILPGLSPTDRY